MGAIQREERGEDWGRGERKAENAHKEERVAPSTSLFLFLRRCSVSPGTIRKNSKPGAMILWTSAWPGSLWIYTNTFWWFSLAMRPRALTTMPFLPFLSPFLLCTQSLLLSFEIKNITCVVFFFNLNSLMILPCFYFGSKLFQGMFEGCANPQRDYRMNKFESYALNKELEAKICHNEKLN